MRGCAATRSLRVLVRSPLREAARSHPALSPAWAERVRGRCWRHDHWYADPLAFPSTFSMSMADSISLLSQQQGGWLRLPRNGMDAAGRASGSGCRGARALSSRQRAEIARHPLEEDEEEVADTDEQRKSDGPVMLYGTEWYAGQQTTARAMLEVLPELLERLVRQDAPVIVNSVSVHSRLAGSARQRRSNRPPQRDEGYQSNGDARGRKTSEDSAANGHHSRLNGHANSDSEGHANGHSNGHANGVGSITEMDSESAELGRLFEEALVVHRGKPGLEQKRPNPYTSESLPAGLAEHIGAANLASSVQQSILSWPIDEDRVPEFFADLLQQWGRERLVPVCGPPTKAEAESATMQWKRTGALPEWRKYSPAADATIEANVVAHPQWGSVEMARQLYSEQRGVDIGVAMYMKQKADTEKRGSGASLGPDLWFEPLSQAIQKWQELFVMSCLKDEALDDLVQATVQNLSEAHRPQHRCPFVEPIQERWNAPTPVAAQLSALRAELAGHSTDDHKKFAEDLKVLGPIFLTISSSKLAVIVMHELMSTLLAHGGTSAFSNVSRRVGRAVQAEWGMDALKGSRNRFQVSMAQVGKAAKARDIRKLNMMLARVFRRPNWDDEALLTKIGARLIAFALEHARFSPSLLQRGGRVLWEAHCQQDDVQAAFVHSFSRTTRGKHKYGLVAMVPELQQLLESSHADTANLTPLLLPMVVKPLPWTAFDTGCYLLVRPQVMRAVDFGEQERLCRAGDMSRIYDALNVLSGTAWTVNDKMLQTVQRAWVQDLVIGDIPSKDDLVLHDLDHIMDLYANHEIDEDERKHRLREHFRVKQRNKDLHSLRCSLINQLHVATTMRQYPAFYFPHNLDFRGRAYPIPPHLNHLGSDICRGLLKFAEKKPLGAKGLYWLKVHLANLFGINKVSFDDRVAWTDQRLHMIHLAAEQPLSEAAREWWLRADEPWQALASCMELSEAIQSGSPETFLSNLPVHQDGSCNGLQHYAAMGLDVIGGEQVNLTPGDKPSDPYTTVCNRVIQVIQTDLDDPLSADHEVAKMVSGKVERKVVKQTVMTTVYGVTFIGARDQIENRLREVYGETGTGELSDKDLAACSSYLARKTLDSVGDIFIGANQTMAWLSQVAQRVAATGRPVQWVTPIGLPVTQPYYRESSKTVRTVLQTVRLRTSGSKDDDKISKGKQRSAFPPNFVHSLDSTHLLLTALEFHRRGGTFAGVHDSFWTHACDYDTLSAVLREQFVQLYTLPILANLKACIERDYPEAGPMPPLPPKGDLDLNVVLRSPYFFS